MTGDAGPMHGDVGLLRRLAAAGYDLLPLTALWMLLTAVFLVFTGGEAMVRGTTLYQLHRLALIIMTLAFFVGFWMHGGQTLGMRAWRIKVVKEDGSALRLSDGLKRVLTALLSLAPAGLGFWWAWLDRDRLAWHDRLSGTRLIRIS